MGQQATPVWLDQQYNNRLRVPESPEILQTWVSRSELARQQYKPQSNLAYGSHPREVLDVFQAKRASALAPVVVYIHGGYWRALSKQEHSFIAPSLCDAGNCVVIPSYPLCPHASIVDITRSLLAALTWVYTRIERFGGDPNRICVVGHSAGGHLAAMLVNCLWPSLDARLPQRVVKHAVCISGIFDLQPIMRTPHLQADLQLTLSQVAQASPARLPPAGLLGSKVTCVVGALESEEFVRQNSLLLKRWGPQAVAVCEALDGLNHFTVLDSLASPTGRLFELVQRQLSNTR